MESKKERNKRIAENRTNKIIDMIDKRKAFVLKTEGT